MHFSKDYFKTETKDGFVISELMKRAWAAQLKVLKKIIDICDRHGLTYYAYWGTLLGAVRHQGYIPWDDDLDIAMKRDDYIKFLEVAKEELPQEYCVLNAYTEPDYDSIFTRITNRHSIDFSPEALEEYYGCPFVVGVDIFPLYYLSRNEEEANIQKMVLEMIMSMSNLEDAKEEAAQNGDYQLANEYNLQIAQGLVDLQDVTSYQFTTDRPIKNQLLILFDQMSRLFGDEESDLITSFPQYLRNGYCVERGLLEESIKVPFENIYINIPKGYDAILEKTYRDYMVPRKVRAAHDYPFYKEQLEVLGEYIERKDAEWKIESCAGGEFVLDETSGCQIPSEWYAKIQSKESDRRKKVILYCNSAASLLGHGELVVDKLKYVFETFKSNTDVVLWWMPCLLNNSKLSFLKEMSPELLAGYEEMIRSYQEENWGIYDDSGDIERAIAMADAYYGDECEVVDRFREEGNKPIMLQVYEIIGNGFGEIIN